VRDVAESVTKNESLIKAEALDVRNLGHKIKHVLDSTSNDSVDGPGGRDDNDFAEFRKIRLLSTSNEFARTEPPFYRRADAIAAIEPENRGLAHLNN
jgi:hypothetical protein